jgi:hypothetical protein
MRRSRMKLALRMERYLATSELAESTKLAVVVVQ